MIRTAKVPSVPLKFASTKFYLTCFAQPCLPLLRLQRKAGNFCSTKPAVAPPAAEVTSTSPSMTEWFQKIVSLPNHSRGCHVVTRQILQKLPELSEYEVGLATFFVQHTSCSLTINENASPDVPLDLNDYLDRVAPEGKHYRHLDEGLDDMPAHLKSSLMGVSLTIPIQQGRLALGTWQGIYLNEHRDYGGTRKIVVTFQGKKRDDGRKFSSYH